MICVTNFSVLVYSEEDEVIRGSFSDVVFNELTASMTAAAAAPGPDDAELALTSGIAIVTDLLLEDLLADQAGLFVHAGVGAEPVLGSTLLSRSLNAFNAFSLKQFINKYDLSAKSLNETICGQNHNLV
jgi:hypothetical protein